MSAASTLHATAVAIEGRALLILGPSGAGKSALALDMIALGAGLIADDVIRLITKGDDVIAASVRPGAGLIEARGIGLLRAPVCGPAVVWLVIDLGGQETARLPEPRIWRHGGAAVPLLYRPEALRPAAIKLALLTGGPVDPALASIGAPDQSSRLRDRVGANGANGVS